MVETADLKQSIIQYSKQIGIDMIGFTTADPFVELKARLYQQQMLRYHSGFEEKDIEKRTEPTLIMDNASTIISIALAYPAKMTERPEYGKGERRGTFCRASWGLDYHTIIKEKLDKLSRFILDSFPQAQVKGMVDTGELSDRAVAERAGIGWTGKHTNLITKKYGSYVYLGELITNLVIEPDQPGTDLCGDCTICIDHCPTGAIVQGGQLNANKCIAFLTQTKQDVPEYYRSAIGNRVYGCDTCQQVCPYNKGIDFHLHEDMEPEPELIKPLLQSLLKLSNREFKDTYGQMAGSWRGKKPIQRNAVLALGNYKEIGALPDLLQLVKEDPRPVIQEAAIWSLSKIAPTLSWKELQKLDETLENLLSYIYDTSVNQALAQLNESVDDLLRLEEYEDKEGI